MVGRELLRVPILWHELWHGALEEASRHFCIDKNPDAMIATLEPLYEMMDAVRTMTFFNSLKV
jgi:FKBP12-rapamycin complex-associated protein